jgi:hypothetical protein
MLPATFVNEVALHCPCSRISGSVLLLTRVCRLLALTVCQVSMFDFNMRPGRSVPIIAIVTVMGCGCGGCGGGGCNDSEYCRSVWPPFTNPGRTYKFYTGKPVLPFGYGLSYSRFLYKIIPELSLSSVSLQQRGMQVLGQVAVNVTNAGDVDADEVVLGFISPPPGISRPLLQLFDFARLHVKAGQTMTGWFAAAECKSRSDFVAQWCCLLPPPASASLMTPVFGMRSFAVALLFPVCRCSHCTLNRYWPSGTFHVRIGVDGSEGTAGQPTPFALHDFEVE